MGGGGIELDDRTIADPIPGQGADKAPVGDDHDAAPVARIAHPRTEGASARVQRFLAFLDRRPPGFLDMIEAQPRPGLGQRRAGRPYVAGKRGALADLRVDRNLQVERVADDQRGLDRPPVRAGDER